MLALGRARAVTITLAAAVSLYALASLAATKAETGACERELAALERSVAELEDENARLLAEVGALESETARLTEDAVPGPGEEISRAAQGQPEQSPAGQTEEASTSN